MNSNKFYTVNPTHMIGIPNYASYQPESFINTQIQKQNEINSSWKYRQYMQNNAKDIMKHNTMSYIQSSGNNPYILGNNTSNRNVPYSYKNIHDTSSPAFGLNNTDLKRDFMTREMINSRMIAPSIPTNF
jgi:hypothetical protein